MLFWTSRAVPLSTTISFMNHYGDPKTLTANVEDIITTRGLKDDQTNWN